MLIGVELTLVGVKFGIAVAAGSVTDPEFVSQAATMNRHNILVSTIAND